MPRPVSLPLAWEQCLQGGDVPPLPVGRWEEVGRGGLQADHVGVSVGIDEAGNHRLPPEVDQPGGFPPHLENLAPVAAFSFGCNESGCSFDAGPAQ